LRALLQVSTAMAADWHAETPNDVRRLRACKRCKLIKTQEQVGVDRLGVPRS
jgi:hypothetical protein